MERFLFSGGDQVRTKICGVTTESQADAIIDLGVDALGFNFWPKSKRFLDPANADWLKNLVGRTLRIGVFVNADKETLTELLEKNFIDWAQLHGDETPEFVAELQNLGLNVFKALGVKNRDSLSHAARFEGPLLLDAYAPTEYGGSGEQMDWALGAEAVKQFYDREVILAGGLNPGNVGSAIAQVHPAGVDVASGVEVSPGIKDLELCRQFIENSRHFFNTSSTGQ